MKELTYLGGIHPLKVDEEGEPTEADVYAGADDGLEITLGVGDTVEVSDDAADRISGDFPGCFEVDGNVVGEKGQPPAQADTVDVETFAKEHKVVELLEFAKKANVPADQVEALSKPGTSRVEIADAIAAHVDDFAAFVASL